MPDYIRNTIKTTDPNIIPSLIGKDGEVDFNKLVPMPESLNIENSSLNDEAIVYFITEKLTIPVKKAKFPIKIYNVEDVFNGLKDSVEKGTISNLDELYELGKQCVFNYENYGHCTWYHWCIENWGTKWNASETFIQKPFLVSFNTAWAPPEPIFKALCKKFPDAEITFFWEDDEFCEILVYRNQNGECVFVDELLMEDYLDNFEDYDAYADHDDDDSADYDDDDDSADYDDDDDDVDWEDLSTYDGKCSVYVRFPNKRAYWYNYEGEISIDDRVYVGGRLTGQVGLVEKISRWDNSSYMQMVTEVIKEPVASSSQTSTESVPLTTTKTSTSAGTKSTKKTIVKDTNKVTASIIVKDATSVPAVETRTTKETKTSTLTISTDDFEIENGVLRNYKGKGGDVVIPDGVTSIRDVAFRECESLTSVIFEEGSQCESIGAFAFAHCDSLISITIPSSVTSIGEGAFRECESLTSMIFEEGSQCESIGAFAFAHCDSLISITIPNSVTSIGKYAFCECESLTSVIFEEGSQCESIGDSAFFKCESLTSVTISCVKKIEEYAFWGCKSLEKIIIRDALISIDKGAFQYCKRLESIILPKSLSFVAPNAFYVCCQLSNVYYGGSENDFNEITFKKKINKTLLDANWYYYSEIEPKEEGNFWHYVDGVPKCWNEDENSTINKDSESFIIRQGVLEEDIGNGVDVVASDDVASITDSLFSERESLTSITIPDAVTSVDDSVLTDSGELTSLIIPVSVTTILEEQYKDRIDIVSVSFEKGSKITTISRRAFNDCANLKTITIPKNVTTLEDSAFANCKNLVSVIFEEGSRLKNIEWSCFAECTSLENIILPDSVRSISGSAFRGCSSLKTITIPKGVKNINHFAFSDCGELSSINIPNTITFIGENSFKNCFSLTSISIPCNVTKIGAYAFSGCKALKSVTFEEESLLNKIGNRAFYNCVSLTHLVIPDSVTFISEAAFECCKALTSINLPNGITKLTDTVFSSCGNLTDIVIPSSVTTIGVYAFGGCANLKNLTIPPSVTEIKNMAFFGCINLISVAIPDSVVTIGSNAFRGCQGLTDVTVPKNVVKVSPGLFYGCSNLTKVVISAVTTKISADAFLGCNKLKEICYLGTKEQWNKVSIGARNNCLRAATIIYNFVDESDESTDEINNETTVVDSTTNNLSTAESTITSVNEISSSSFVSSSSVISEGEASPVESALPSSTKGKKAGGCYIATSVYGSYDCPQVWTLRRYRDEVLGSTWYGRLFIKLYYAISPTLVKIFGKTKWFQKMWKSRLDCMVKKLNTKGFEDTPYQDKDWR